MNKNTASPLDLIGKLLTMGEDENSKSRWIVQAVDNYLEQKKVDSIEELVEDDRWALVEVLKSGFVDNDQPLPDYLVDKTDSSVGEKPVHEKAESDVHKELTKANMKLEVATGFLKDLDAKLAKYESMDIDSVAELLEQYESIGTPEDLREFIAKHKEESEESEVEETEDKSEADTAGEVLEEMNEEQEEDDDDPEKDDECEDESKDEAKKEKSEDESETDNPEKETSEKLETDESVNNETNQVGDEMSDKETVTPKNEAESQEMDDMKKLLARYQELGTPEEIEELIERSDEMVSNNSELTEKTESLQESLSKYESIGDPEEILGVVTEYAEIKQKAESERIAGELGIPVEKVRSTIDKMESVQEAEELLSQLFAKTEADEEVEEEVKAKTESVEEEAELVDDAAAASTGRFGKGKLESARRTQLSQICSKL